VLERLAAARRGDPARMRRGLDSPVRRRRSSTGTKASTAPPTRVPSGDGFDPVTWKAGQVPSMVTAPTHGFYNEMVPGLRDSLVAPRGAWAPVPPRPKDPVPISCTGSDIGPPALDFA
jgi:hypothetical protein